MYYKYKFSHKISRNSHRTWTKKEKKVIAKIFKYEDNEINNIKGIYERDKDLRTHLKVIRNYTFVFKNPIQRERLDNFFKDSKIKSFIDN